MKREVQDVRGRTFSLNSWRLWLVQLREEKASSANENFACAVYRRRTKKIPMCFPHNAGTSILENTPWPYSYEMGPQIGSGELSCLVVSQPQSL